MLSILSQRTMFGRLCLVSMHRSVSFSKVKPLATNTATESDILREHIKLNNNSMACTSMAMSQTSSTTKTDTLSRTEPMSVLAPRNETPTTDIFKVSTIKNANQIVADKTPLPFEDIPGPAILKLWEKYWRYVPLLGTQLFSSLLINKFTLGRLHWNRNITPVKYLFNEYGCIVRINGPLSGDIVMIHRPEHIAEVFKQEGNIPIRSGIDVLEHYRLHHRKYRLAGAFSMQGKEWLDLKQRVDKPFNQILSKYFRQFEMISEELINRIRKIRNRQDEVPANFHQELIRWGMECFCVFMLNRKLGFLDATGLNPSSEPAKFIDALITAHTYLSRCETGFQVWRFFDTPFSKKLFSACDIIDGIIGKHIREVQAKLKNRSSAYYSKKNVNPEEDSPILEKFLLDQSIHPDDVSTLFMDMIILGVQATTSCEAFLLYFLAKNPRAQRKLYEEIISFIPNRRSTLTEDNLKDMLYLKACLKETLRLRPAFPYVTRLLANTISLHGYTIPKGTFVIMANQITSQREENFDDPEKFRPERWLTNQDDDNVYHECSYLPFGHGMRSCLGKYMAETKMSLVTAKLVREFKVEYDYADIGSSFYMINLPNKPLRLRFIDRD